MANARARLAADAGEFEHAGARLAAAREGRGLSLRDAAARTHIRENHLAAIEALDLKGLPARPYALGFVRTYAEFLDLDGRAVVEQFKADAGFDAPPPIETEKFRAAEEAAAEDEPAGLSLPVFLSILAFILWCAWQITLTEPVAPAAAPERPVSQPVVSAAPAPVVAAGEVVAPRLTYSVEPVYPHGCAANARPVETVSIIYAVSAAGRVTGERISESSNACFNAAALNAVKRWEFEPQTVNGAPKPAFDQVRQFRFQRPQ